MYPDITATTECINLQRTGYINAPSPAKMELMERISRANDKLDRLLTEQEENDSEELQDRIDNVEEEINFLWSEYWGAA